jgi:hypothetical protein
MEVSSQLHALVALPPEKYLRYPLDDRRCFSQRKSGRGGVEKKIFPLSVIDLLPSSP